MPGGRRLRRVCCVVGAAASIAAGCSDDRGFDVLSPGAVVDGGQDAISLLGEYWKGMLELPSEQTVIVDPGECDMGLSGEAAYFAPTLSGSDETAAMCSAPEGAVIVVLPASVVCVEEGIDKADVPCLESMWNLTSSSVVVDGRPEAELTQFEVDSEEFVVRLGEANLVRLRPGVHRAIARGQVVMLEGLARGRHVIELSARFAGDGGNDGTLAIELEVVTSTE